MENTVPGIMELLKGVRSDVATNIRRMPDYVIQHRKTKEVFFIEIKFFSYPYGSYNNKTIEVLKNENFFCAITTDFDINKGMQENLFALKRLDTNHVFLKL